VTQYIVGIDPMEMDGHKLVVIILICPIINRYFELPKELLISYKSDWGNLFWTYFAF
jgi:hypothetical protein